MDNEQNSGGVPETQVPVAPAPQVTPEAPSGTPAPAPAPMPNTGERRGMAAISYLGIFCIIPLLFARESAFAQYHAKQGVVLAIAGIILRLASDALWNVPFGGVFAGLLFIVLLLISIMGIVKALQGEKFDIPYVSEWAAKMNF